MFRKLVPSICRKTLNRVSRQHFNVIKFNTSAIATRSFSSEVPKSNGESSSPSEEDSIKREVMKYDSDEYDDYEPKTKQEKIAMYGNLFMRLLLLAAGVACGFYAIKELIPSRMGPQSIFGAVFDMLQNNDDVREIVGDGMKAFGRDTGRNTEGRRNHIDFYKYVANDGSERTRVRFNIKGNKSQVLVWAEVSSDMKDDEYVYIVCQNVRTGRVLTVIDNRESVDAGLTIPRDKNDGFVDKIMGFFSPKTDV